MAFAVSRPVRVLSLALAFMAAWLWGGAHAAAQPGVTQAQVVQWLRQGGAAVHKGDFEAAQALFKKAVAAAPTLSDGYLGLGLTQLRLGDFNESIQSLKRAVELNSQLPGAHLFLGIAQYQSGDAKDAADSLKAEIALRPREVEALKWLGIVELGLNDPAEATDPLDRAAELSPKDPNILYYKARAHILVAEQAYRSLYALDPDSALVHRARGDMLANSGEAEQAIAEYQLAARKAPHNPDLYELIGDQEQKISHTDAAIAAYESELKINGHSAIALYNLGMIRIKQGNAAAGVPLLRRAQAEHASPAPTDYYLGVGLAMLNQNEEAAHWLEAALANHPSNFVEQGSYFQLARVYRRLNRAADARRALDKLKQLKAESARTITRAETQGTSARP